MKYIRWITRPIGKIIKILQYIPVLWSNEDWDHVWFFELIKYKLTRMKACLRHGYGEGNVKGISEAIYLLEQLIDDEFCDKEFNKHYKKWGSPEFHFFEKEDGVQKISKMNILHKHVHNDSDKKKELDDLCKIGELEVARRKDTLAKLLKIIENDVDKWWD